MGKGAVAEPGSEGGGQDGASSGGARRPADRSAGPHALAPAAAPQRSRVERLLLWHARAHPGAGFCGASVRATSRCGAKAAALLHNMRALL